MKTLLIAGAASFLAAPAFAGPYVNLENNAGFTGSDFEGSVTETHVGYESALGDSSSWYIQGGPAFVSPDGEGTTTELSGKVGIGADVTERVNVYAEIAAQTQDEINFDEDLNLGTKLGVKYSF
jgi:outer membrane autotransporter protein